MNKNSRETRKKYEKEYGVTLDMYTHLHHIDLDKNNSEIENLFPCSEKIHMGLHKQLTKLIIMLIKTGRIQFDGLQGNYYFVESSDNMEVIE